VSSECGAPILPILIYAGSGSGAIERKEYVVNYDEENRLLERYGFHLAYDPEDAAEFPEEANPEGEVWQLGPSGDPARVQEFTRQQALDYARAREGKS